MQRYFKLKAGNVKAAPEDFTDEQFKNLLAQANVAGEATEKEFLSWRQAGLARDRKIIDAIQVRQKPKELAKQVKTPVEMPKPAEIQTAPVEIEIEEKPRRGRPKRIADAEGVTF